MRKEASVVALEGLDRGMRWRWRDGDWEDSKIERWWDWQRFYTHDRSENRARSVCTRLWPPFASDIDRLRLHRIRAGSGRAPFARQSRSRLRPRLRLPSAGITVATTQTHLRQCWIKLEQEERIIYHNATTELKQGEGEKGIGDIDDDAISHKAHTHTCGQVKRTRREGKNGNDKVKLSVKVGIPLTLFLFVGSNIIIIIGIVFIVLRRNVLVADGNLLEDGGQDTGIGSPDRLELLSFGVEEDERGHGGDVVQLGHVRELVDVDGDEVDVLERLGGPGEEKRVVSDWIGGTFLSPSIYTDIDIVAAVSNILFKERLDRLAGAAPGGGEVDDGRPAGLESLDEFLWSVRRCD